MSTDYDLPEDVDFLLVRRDDELLDAIAGRQRGYTGLGELAADRAVALLAAFAADVDDGLEELLAAVGAEAAEPAPVPAAALVPVQAGRPGSERRAAVQPVRTAAPRPSAPRRAHHVGRAGAAAAVVVAVLSASGVAAAVTGNPLAPAQSVAHAVAAVFGHGPNQHANDRAKLESSMHDVDALIRAGRLDEARALLAQLESQNAALGDKSTQGIENQLAALESKLARATAAATTKPTPPGATKAPNSNKPTAPPSPTPKPTRTTGRSAQTPPVVVPTTPAPSPTATRTHPTHSAPGGKNAPTKS